MSSYSLLLSYHCKVMAENATLRREVNALREASSHVPMKLRLICGASSLRVAGSRCACSATQARRSSTLHVYGEGTKEGEESVWEKDIALRGTPRATSVACTHTQEYLKRRAHEPRISSITRCTHCILHRRDSTHHQPVQGRRRVQLVTLVPVPSNAIKLMAQTSRSKRQ